MAKRSARPIIFRALVVIITYILFELACLLLIVTGYIPAPKPGFDFIWSNRVSTSFTSGNDAWGNWHVPGRTRYQDACLSFDYVINSIGARDKERSRTGSDRCIVLGDSYIEGWGVPVDKRVSDLLEKKTGKEFLNFGCATLGLTQELLVYKHLASRYEHNTVLIGFLPYNDFDNDNPAARTADDFYRPYFEPTDTGYRLVYKGIPPSAAKSNDDPIPGNDGQSRAVRFLKSYTVWYNVFSYLKNRKTPAITAPEGKAQSFYFDHKPEQIAKVKYILQQFRALAGEKRIILFSIPVLNDVRRMKEEKGPSPLYTSLSAICSDLGIEYLDLATSGRVVDESWFQTCDPHWSEAGNQAAGELLYERFFAPQKAK